MNFHWVIFFYLTVIIKKLDVVPAGYVTLNIGSQHFTLFC